MERLAASQAAAPTGMPAEVAADPALLAALLEAAPVGFACFDTDLRFVHVNRLVAQANGRPAEEHLGKTLREVAPGLASDLETHARAVLTTGRSQESVELSGVLRGRPSHWTTSWYPVRDQLSGRVRGVAVLATDVTGLVATAETVRQTALTLQRFLLPTSTPSTEELEIAVRYDAGVAETEVGGDWYDVIPLGAGRLALVVGDVMGRGVHAAAVMGQMRTAVRTCARLDLRPVEVLEVLDGLVSELGPDGVIGTCIYAVFDPHRRELLLASAGHLPPVVRRADGSVHRLEIEVSAPLGVGDAPRQTRVRLEAGTVLLMFTDGLVEVRGSDIDAGFDALCRVVSSGPEDLEALADAVLHRLSTDDADDDVALLLARVPLDVDSRSRTVVVHVPSEIAQLSDVRGVVQRALSEWALLDDLVHTTTVIASELVANALMHGKGPVELRLRLTRDRLVIEVEERGRHMPRRRRVDDDDESGHGLHVIAALADRWGARPTDDGKVVWAELSLA